MVSSLLAKDMQNLLVDVISEVLPWSTVSRNHFRSKVLPILHYTFMHINFTQIVEISHMHIHFCATIGHSHSGDYDTEVWFCCSSISYSRQI